METPYSNTPKTLFHFTSHLHLPYIQKSGIRRGDVPHSPQDVPGDHVGVWLTSDKDTSRQQWSQAFTEPPLGVYKTDVLLRVSFPLLTPARLIPWTDYAHIKGISPEWIRAMDKAGGGHSAKWWIYEGVIPPAWFEAKIIRERAYSRVKKEEFLRHIDSPHAKMVEARLDPSEVANSFLPHPETVATIKPGRFRVPEVSRVTMGQNATTKMDGNNGAFMLRSPEPGNPALRCLATDGQGWEHVSVSLVDRIPTWTEMSFVRDTFWEPDACVIQYHPPHDQYINHHPFCLHLWRPNDYNPPTPPAFLVGTKK